MEVVQGTSRVGRGLSAVAHHPLRRTALVSKHADGRRGASVRYRRSGGVLLADSVGAVAREFNVEDFWGRVVVGQNHGVVLPLEAADLLY